MGRRKTCDKLGQEHQWEDLFVSIGGWCLGMTQARLETKCKMCSKKKTQSQDKDTFFVFDPIHPNSNERGWRNLTKEEKRTIENNERFT